MTRSTWGRWGWYFAAFSFFTVRPGRRCLSPARRRQVQRRFPLTILFDAPLAVLRADEPFAAIRSSPTRPTAPPNQPSKAAAFSADLAGGSWEACSAYAVSQPGIRRGRPERGRHRPFRHCPDRSYRYGIWWFIKKKRQTAESTAGAASIAMPRRSICDRRTITHRRRNPTINRAKKLPLRCPRHIGAWTHPSKNSGSVINVWTSSSSSRGMGKPGHVDRPLAAVRRDAWNISGAGGGTEERQEDKPPREYRRCAPWILRRPGRKKQGLHYGSLLRQSLDYTIDEHPAGPRRQQDGPVKFEEYWTFTRPIGNNPWQLAAVAQA